MSPCCLSLASARSTNNRMCACALDVDARAPSLSPVRAAPPASRRAQGSLSRAHDCPLSVLVQGVRSRLRGYAADAWHDTHGGRQAQTAQRRV